MRSRNVQLNIRLTEREMEALDRDALLAQVRAALEAQ